MLTPHHTIPPSQSWIMEKSRRKSPILLGKTRFPVDFPGSPLILPMLKFHTFRNYVEIWRKSPSNGKHHGKTRLTTTTFLASCRFFFLSSKAIHWILDLHLLCQPIPHWRLRILARPTTAPSMGSMASGWMTLALELISIQISTTMVAWKHDTLW